MAKNMCNLQVGDWVLYSEQVSNIDGDYDLVWFPKQIEWQDFAFAHENDWNERDWNEFVKPISLTKEILELNGIPTNGDTFFFKEDKESNLELCYRDGNLYWTINCAEYDIMTFEYMHELQHALRLCRMYKLANNLKIDNDEIDNDYPKEDDVDESLKNI